MTGHDPRQGRADLAIAVTALIWGSTFTVVKDALADVSPLAFLAARFSLAAILLWAIFRRRFSFPDQPRLFLQAGVITSGLLFLGYALQTIGLERTTASKSAFLTALYIVLVPLFAPCVSKVRASIKEFGGAAMALAGTGLMTSTGAGFRLGPGDLLTLGCAVAFAGHLLAVEHFSRRMNFHLLSVLQVAGVALWSLLTFFWAETPRLAWSPAVVFALLVTVVFATAISFALYTWAQQHTTATHAAVLFSLEPVFAGLIAWAIAGETWTLRVLAGAAMILGGILVVELKPARTVGHPSD